MDLAGHSKNIAHAVQNEESARRGQNSNVKPGIEKREKGTDSNSPVMSHEDHSFRTHAADAAHMQGMPPALDQCVAIFSYPHM